MMFTLLAAGMLLSVVCAAQPFRPVIPKTWDEEALRTMELPLATPEASPVHISAERYYAIPERRIYKTYPPRMPGKTEEEYYAWLREQEPELIAAEKLVTKEDWIRAGEAVFNWPPIIRDAPLRGVNSVPVVARLVIRTKGKIEFASNGSCASCHTRQMQDGTRLPGAQMNLERLWNRPPATAADFVRLRTSRLFPELTAPWFNPDPNDLPEALPLLTFSRLQTRIPAPAPRFHTSFWSPANMPSLIGIRDLRYLDRTGLVQHRDIGDLMRYAALNFGGGDMSATSSFGKFLPGRIRPNLERLSDAHLYALALYIYSLEPPPNPNPSDQLAAEGKRIFERTGCGGCHPAPLYTNNKLTPAPGFRVPPEHKKLYDVMPVSVGTDPWLAMKTRRGSGYYKVPSLRGVWYRGPFEHNGSVLKLEDWFDANRLRDDYVPTGWLGPNETRAVKGHEFGLNLEPDEKKALIAFLKTL